MNAAQKVLMVAMVACGSILLGGSFGYEGGFGLVVGGVGLWFSPAFAIIGGLAGLGLLIVLWVVYDAVVDYLA